MAEFIINQEVKTETPTVEVTLSPDRPLRLGRHTFRLVVVDDSGNTSIPDDVIVIVADSENPTAVLNAPRTAASAPASISTAAAPSMPAAARS